MWQMLQAFSPAKTSKLERMWRGQTILKTNNNSPKIAPRLRNESEGANSESKQGRVTHVGIFMCGPLTTKCGYVFLSFNYNAYNHTRMKLSIPSL